MRKSLYDYCIERELFLLLVQWDREKNAGLTPRDVSHGSHKKVWWQCASGHQWEAAVYTRTSAGSGCPYCAGKRPPPNARTLAAYPELVKQWHPTKNSGLSPSDISPAAHRKVWWLCEKGHAWQARVSARTSGTGCPICTNRQLKPGENDLAAAYPELANQWHPEKNGALRPQEVLPGSHRKVWWQCGRGHSWQATILSRTSSGTGCPICAGKQVAAGVNDLASTFPQIAAQWHPTKNGVDTPQTVTAYSNRRVWWLCDKGHAYQTVVAHRTRSASDCPYCAGRKVLAGFNDLATKHPELTAQWHQELNGSLTPQMLTAGSSKRVWWQCAEGHVWKAVVYSRAGPQKCGCPVCAGKRKQPQEPVSNRGSSRV